VNVPRPVRLAYRLPASSTFLSQQISHHQSANRTFLSEQISTSHQPNEQAHLPGEDGDLSLLFPSHFQFCPDDDDGSMIISCHKGDITLFTRAAKGFFCFCF
jgi:hypothetical protein